MGQPPQGIASLPLPWVYPHVCGAAAAASTITAHQLGLSPRVWGSQAEEEKHQRQWRSIPTCVGQPSVMTPSKFQIAVYPHVCGAATWAQEELRPIYGLSPRVWGSRDNSIRNILYGRSIPTCVGQPRDECRRFRIRKVYPHVCGAAPRLGHSEKPQRGLSPRVWGSLLSFRSVIFFVRSIPTCVGQPLTMMPGKRRHQVYPHVCGAAVQPTPTKLSKSGLSPRVWGSQG